MKKNIKHREILIGKNIKDLRETLGVTQEEVSKALQLAPRYVSDLERDKTKGSLTTLVKLCNFYNVSPDFILKDYLDFYNADEYNNDLIEFYNLSRKEKNIVKKLIQFMNKNKRKK